MGIGTLSGVQPTLVPRQRSFDDLGTPLSEVTFVVVDLETTGGSPEACRITEIGAVKLRGGECLGRYQTLVNPGVAIPPEIVYLTGITEAMVGPAPKIEQVLPSFLEFLGDAVLVGHNVRFDLSFLNVALAREGRPRLTNVNLDTCALARRLVREEVRDCRLGTLSRHFRVSHQPTHRALDDALATGELLHCLLERAGTFGVLALDDLLALPRIQGHPQLAKLPLVAGLPRAPGVYLFRDAGGRVLYVGKAVDLRRRVRSYFTGDSRRKIGPLLRELHAVDHVECASELEAAVLEVRLIHELVPRYNRRGKRPLRAAYLKLTLDERFPRLSVVRVARPGDGCLYLGPIASSSAARQIADAIEQAVPIRRCTGRPGRVLRDAPCTPAQLGVAACPCAGSIGQDEYRAIVERVVRGLTLDPSELLDPLAARMRSLAADGRFEEAADVRDRAGALARAIGRQRRLDALRRSGVLRVAVGGGVEIELDGGMLRDIRARGPAAALARKAGDAIPRDLHPEAPLPRDLADELACVAAWIEQRASRLRLLSCDAGLSSVVPRLPRFEPAVQRRTA